MAHWMHPLLRLKDRHFEASLQLLALLWSVAPGVWAQGPDQGYYYMPGLNLQPYEQEGDINVGAVIGWTLGSQGSAACTSRVIPFAYALQATEAVAFAVGEVNRNHALLPNVSMGFVIRDGCQRTATTLTNALAFLPLNAPACGNATDCPAAVTSSSAHFDVIGVVGPATSATAVPTSLLYSVAHLPLVGYAATSDTLSDKSEHPYYFRVVPPDMHQVEAMLEFISDNGWSYISVVYAQGAYGEKAYDNIKGSVDRFGICIATQHRLISSVSFHDIASDLVAHARARVVVLFGAPGDVGRLFQAVAGLNYSHHFIWIGSDGWAYGFENDLRPFQDVAVGAISFTYFASIVPELYEHIGNLSVNASRNPLLKDVWEFLVNCSFQAGTCDPNENILLSERNSFFIWPSLIIDSVLTYAHAAHDLIRNVCPDARGKDARACISGELLREYLRNVSFDGFTGPIEFDRQNDVKGRYLIRQIQYDYKINSYLERLNYTPKKDLVVKNIAVYDTVTGNITYHGERVSWSHLDQVPRVVPLPEGAEDDGLPESVCSRPCVLGEYKIEKELPCCWDCRTCRDNERLVEGETNCEECPSFTWPDPVSNYTTCVEIPATYQSLNDSLPILLFCMAAVSILFTLLVIAAFVRYRNERIIKASSRELSLLQLLAVALGFVAVMVSQLQPTDATCKLMYLLFCLSFSWLYCPLLVKTVRIFRLFRNTIKDNIRPRLVSPQSQMVLTLLLDGVQVVLCIITVAQFNPGTKLHQPVSTNRLVEVTCDLTVPGLAAFLAYNLVLVTLCSVFAFKTRKLPDNFNESRFISMCVSTTLVIWLAFIPTYFTASRVFVQAMLLSLALLLNHWVALVFLFVPRIYAAIWVPPDQGNFVTTRFQNQLSLTPSTSLGHPPTANNRVAPLK